MMEISKPSSSKDSSCKHTVKNRRSGLTTANRVTHYERRLFLRSLDANQDNVWHYTPST